MDSYGNFQLYAYLGFNGSARLIVDRCNNNAKARGKKYRQSDDYAGSSVHSSTNRLFPL